MATSLRPADTSPDEATEAKAPPLSPTSAVAQVVTALTAILYPDDAAAATACAAATTEYDDRVSGEIGGCMGVDFTELTYYNYAHPPTINRWKATSEGLMAVSYARLPGDISRLGKIEPIQPHLTGGGDAQGACLDLLRRLGGDASRVVRAVKLVHQGVVLYAISKLRLNQIGKLSQSTFAPLL